MEYHSSDFYISSCILASGIPLKGLKKISDRSYAFIFHDQENQIEKIIADHWNRTLLLPTKDLIEAINQLKTRLHLGV